MIFFNINFFKFLRLIEDKEIFLIWGMSKDIWIYRNDNFIFDKNNPLLNYQISNYISDYIFKSIWK